MARYIDADKFAERIRMSPAFKNLGCEGELLQRVVLDLVDNAPSVDVAEKNEGGWKGQGFGDYRCSLCWETYSGANRFSYCPNCGAKMDGGD